MTDVKDIAKAIVSSREDDGGNGSSDPGAREDLEVAAGNILSASKSGDSSELASCLREFISLCKEG